MKPWTPLSIAFVVTACSGGGTTAKTTPDVPPDAAPAPVPEVFEPASMLTGAWTAASFGNTLVWLRPGRPDGAIYGVALTDPPAVWVIDDEPTDVPADQRWLRLTAYEPEATAPRSCDEDRDQPEGLWFNCTDDAGGTLRFMQNGELLDYEFATDTAGPYTFHHSPSEVARAPDAEAADAAFDADTDQRGVDGWMAWFADDGVMWDDERRSVGRAAIGAVMKPVLEGGSLRWQPTRSALAPEGTLAVTAGVFQAGPATGTYVTVWRNDPEGWRAIFDVGRRDPP